MSSAHAASYRPLPRLQVTIQSPTAFVMGEMAAGIAPFEANPLFTGGDDGEDTAIMIGRHDLGGFRCVDVHSV